MTPEYPLSEKSRHLLKSPRGAPFDEITLEAVLEGRVTMEDLRITPEALELQARIADGAGRSQLAENLRRAAELAELPEELIPDIYNALRPNRSTREQLLALADELELNRNAPRTAGLVREAARVSDRTRPDQILYR